jgi:glutathione S-transferase
MKQERACGFGTLPAAALYGGKVRPMQLYFAYPSPYSRKVRVVAHELGIALDLVEVNALAWDNGYGAINPLNRVPALLRDDATVLVDSPVICEYLDVLAGSPLLPTTGDARWSTLTRQAWGDGLMDAAVPRRHETTRPQNLQSPERLKLYRRSMDQVLDHLEHAINTLSEIDLGTISIACALSYIDFRFADDSWDATRPQLRKWLSGMLLRPTMQTTPFS